MSFHAVGALENMLCAAATKGDFMLKLVAALVVNLVLFLAPQDLHAAAAGKQVVIAYAAMNARVAPLWVARDRGFFAKYGVAADTIFVRGAPTLVAAMQANEIDVGYTGGRPWSEPWLTAPI
jgi:ABC-type nitrate/sulfonate/bicarbonate transport system substrate-binding protein